LKLSAIETEFYYLYLLGSFGIVRDEQVIKDGTRFHLPQVKTSDANFIEFTNCGVGGVFRVVDFRMNPNTL
jgi:hypothetical protein